MLGLNGGGPYMICSTHEDLSHFLDGILETADEAIANRDEYIIKLKYMTPEEIENLPEFPGW
jgi:hypothetical protein